MCCTRWATREPQISFLMSAKFTCTTTKLSELFHLGEECDFYCTYLIALFINYPRSYFTFFPQLNNWHISTMLWDFSSQQRISKVAHTELLKLWEWGCLKFFELIQQIQNEKSYTKWIQNSFLALKWAMQNPCSCLPDIPSARGGLGLNRRPIKPVTE